MNRIDGINTEFNYKNLIRVSDLIYFDGPLLSLYVNKQGNYYLFYWVDNDTSNNRWLLCRVSSYTLQEYLNKKLTLYNLIASQDSGLVYVVDIDSNADYKNTLLVKLQDLDPSYLPAEDSLYDFEPDDNIDLNAFSTIHGTGLMEIHLTGSEINYGSILLETFSTFLSNIEKLRERFALRSLGNFKKRFHAANCDLKRKNNKVFHKKLKEKSEEFISNTKYEIAYKLAGSYRIILQPYNKQKYLLDTKNDLDKFTEEFFTLFDVGTSSVNFDEVKEIYGFEVLKKYEELLKNLLDKNIDVKLNWHNNQANFKKSNFLNRDRLKIILKNLNEIKYNDEPILVIGKFYSLNIKNGNYDFECTDGTSLRSKGKLSKAIISKASSIDFKHQYEVSINRRFELKASQYKKVDEVIDFKNTQL